MADTRSLADAAVEALAAVARMEFGVENEHAERHDIRTLKRIATQSLDDAFRRVSELAWLAEDMHRTGEKARATPPTNGDSNA